MVITSLREMRIHYFESSAISLDDLRGIALIINNSDSRRSAHVCLVLYNRFARLNSMNFQHHM
jgi:hypothetical protein